MLWTLMAAIGMESDNSASYTLGAIASFFAGWTAQSLDNKFKKLEKANEQNRNYIKSIFGINHN